MGKTAQPKTPNEKYSPEYKKKVQTLLKEEGFFKSDITGNYLSKTTEAARQMQKKLKDLGYTMPYLDGDFGDKSMAAYNEYVKNGRKAKTAVANGTTGTGEKGTNDVGKTNVNQGGTGTGTNDVGKTNVNQGGTGTGTNLTNGSGITIEKKVEKDPDYKEPDLLEKIGAINPGEYAKAFYVNMKIAMGNIIGRFTDRVGTGADDAKQTKFGTYMDANIDLSGEYTKKVSTKGILGVPPRFSAYCDLRMFSFDNDLVRDMSTYVDNEVSDGTLTFYSDPFEGTKWLDVYMKWGSLVFLEIGRPVFFKGLGKEAIQAVLSGGDNAADEVTDAARDVMQSNEGMQNLITFSPAGVDYAYQVKVLTDTVATFLDLNGSTLYDFKNDYDKALTRGATLYDSIKPYAEYFGIPQSYGDVTEKLDDADLQRANIKALQNGNTGDSKTDKKNDKKGYIQKFLGRFDLNPFTNDILADVTSSTICLYADGGVESPFNMTHQIGPSSLLSKVTDNPVTSSVNEVAFLDSDFDVSTDALSDNGMLEKTGLGGWIKKMLGIIPVGAKLIAPQVWQGTDISKEVTVKCTFQTTNPHPISIFNHILVPYLHIFAAFAPKNITKVTTIMANRIGAYAPPFVCRMYTRGAVNINLGMITSLVVDKVPKDLTVNGLPTKLTVTITIKDLYDVVGIPTHPSTRLSVIACAGLTEYLSSLTGVIMSQEKLMLKYMNADTATYIMNAPVRFANRMQQSILNSYNEHIKGLTNIVYGKLNRI